MNGWPYSQVWAVDFEFTANSGETPQPICMVAHELRSGTTVRLWTDELRRRRFPPFATDESTLFVAYYASAEIGCFLELGWPVPVRILDLFVEFRVRTNGTYTKHGNSLIGAMLTLGLDGVGTVEKTAMRGLAIRGAPFTPAERNDLLTYCEADVLALKQLLLAMAPAIDLPRALLRGRYMVAAARIERTGIPLDSRLYATLVQNWDSIKDRLIIEVDKDFGVYEGATFKRDRFLAYLSKHDIPWPLLQTGIPDLTDDTFRQMVKAHVQLAPLRELRHTLSQLRLAGLAVGRDGRNRTRLSAFRSQTSRNQPSNTEFIFGPSVWLRSMIKPPPGRAIAYVDWSQQEFGIAAALSVDDAMLDAYRSGDPYLAFAKRARAVPADATKKSHGTERELYKICALAVQFGMEAKSLAQQIGQPEVVARNLLTDHHRLFHKFWKWSDGVATRFSLFGSIHTMFGWPLRNGMGKSHRTARNFPVQAAGAEMMRLAACLMTEAGITVCAPVHDAFLIEANNDEIEATVAAAQDCMAEASRIVLDCLELRSDATVVRYPDRYRDVRGARMFELITQLLARQSAESVLRKGEFDVRPAPVVCAAGAHQGIY